MDDEKKDNLKGLRQILGAEVEVRESDLFERVRLRIIREKEAESFKKPEDTPEEKKDMTISELTAEVRRLRKELDTLNRRTFKSQEM